MNGISRRAATAALAIMGAMALVLGGCSGGSGDGPPASDRGTIVGQVVHADTELALGGITVSAGGVTTTTNDTGEFRLRQIPAGQYTLQVQADPERNLQVWGTPGDRRVTVVGGQTTNVGTVYMIDPLDLPDPPAL